MPGLRLSPFPFDYPSPPSSRQRSSVWARSRSSWCRPAIAEDVMREKLAKSYLSPAQKTLLRKEQAETPVKMRTAFETAFRAWKDTGYSGGLAISSDPHTRAVG